MPRVLMAIMHCHECNTQHCTCKCYQTRTHICKHARAHLHTHTRTHKNTFAYITHTHAYTHTTTPITHPHICVPPHKASNKAGGPPAPCQCHCSGL